MNLRDLPGLDVFNKPPFFGIRYSLSSRTPKVGGPGENVGPDTEHIAYGHESDLIVRMSPSFSQDSVHREP